MKKNMNTAARKIYEFLASLSEKDRKEVFDYLCSLTGRKHKHAVSLLLSHAKDLERDSHECTPKIHHVRPKPTRVFTEPKSFFHV